MTRTIQLWAGSLPVKRFDGRELPYCRCGESMGFLARGIISNGTSQLRWQCESCGDTNSFNHIPHAFLEQFELLVADLPVCFDLSQRSEPCEVCGEQGTEWHHWAPSSLFPWSEYPQWADVGAYLCLRHHREWHDRMRAHGLRWPSELVASAE